MKNFFIRALERIIAVVLVLGAIGVVIGAFAAMMMPSAQGGGLIPAVMILVGGAIYLMIVGGMVFLGIGIYDNTKRSAEALERLANRP